jgi:DNA-binding response OmpR family regulator
MAADAGRPVLARILLVVDREPVGSLFRAGLVAGGCEVEVVADGVEAVERVLAGNFDLVVIDVGLPGKAAPDVVAALRSAVTSATGLEPTDPDTKRSVPHSQRRCR